MAGLQDSELSGQKCPGSGQFGMWHASRFIEDGEPSDALCPACARRVEIVGRAPGRLADHERESELSNA